MQKLGFRCDRATRIRVSRNDESSSPDSSPLAADAEAIILLDEGGAPTQLYVLAQGH
ncbi:hypothetical protein [Jongsikchunia kroppenstedtii]|uniref:hypothetical protein n=1 Tax=Jongsikchunia kroppenstedtii TaxID=1121721 RepID=UPI0003A21DCD|nr:hypothetical protein [Jongsikchunia kroppenstedtii]